MNHSYQIVTNEVDKARAGQRRFVAHLANIFVEVDGEDIEAPYPNAKFEGLTYASAMLQANDAFKKWLAIYQRRKHVVKS